MLRKLRIMIESGVNSLQSPILFGNTFPLPLIRRKVVIEPQSLDVLRTILKERPFFSFWGHENTEKAASNVVGKNIKPGTNRPALSLDAEYFPLIDGRSFDECWVLSTDYRPAFRPRIGEEVSADDIMGWQVLRIKWER